MRDVGPLIRSVLVLMAAIFVLPMLVVAQSPRRNVTVNVTKGEPIKGQFLRADEQSVTIQNGVAETTVKFEDVISIVFDEAPRVPIIKHTQIPEAVTDEDALRAVDALRKLASATEVGVNFAEYGRILIDAKSEVDGLLPKIKDGTTRSFISSSLAHYVYANEVWNYFIRYPRAGIATKSDMGRELINKYEIPIKISVWTSIDRGTALSYIWRKARQDYEWAKGHAEK